LFAGANKLAGLDTIYSNSMYKLNLKTFKWEQLSSKGKQPSPRDKTAGWLFDDKFIFILFYLKSFNFKPTSSY
jgi:hypothetical protein